MSRCLCRPRRTRPATQTSLSVFLCPSDQLHPGWHVPGHRRAVGTRSATVAPSSYAASTGNDAADVALGLNNDGSGNGIFFRNSSIRIAAITDGTSQTSDARTAWANTEGTWTGAIPGGVIYRGPMNPCPGPETRPIWLLALSCCTATCSIRTPISTADWMIPRAFIPAAPTPSSATDRSIS